MSDSTINPAATPVDSATAEPAPAPGPDRRQYVMLTRLELQQAKMILDLLDLDFAMVTSVASVLSVHGDEDVNRCGFYFLNSLNAIQARLSQLGALIPEGV